MRELSNRTRKLRNRIILIPVLVLFSIFMASSTSLSDLQKVQASGQLTMITMPGHTTYFEDGRGKNGFDYLLAKAFADSLGVELVVNTKPTLRRLLLSVGTPQGDFAAANIVKTTKRNQSLSFATPYLNVTQQLVYRSGSKRPKSLNDLDGELIVIADSSHSEQLKKLQTKYPNLSWVEQDQAEMSDLIRRVHEGEIKYTIVDSLAYLISRHLYPRARRAFDISEPQQMAWAFATHNDGTLLAAANGFLSDYIESGELDNMTEELLAQTENFSAADSQRLSRLTAKRLPAYEALFRQTAAQFNVDWHLLAALSYQESHWNPRAKSPTGVRGMMMLTLDTAREMNVSNRLDPAQSIEGGTAYLLKLKARLPKRILDPDRTLLALAAYNVGFGHLEDARILTQRNGKNPDVWADVRLHLPMLSDKKFYSTLRHGYARGNEPVVYVDNIQYYRTFLRLHSLSQQTDKPEVPETNGVEAIEWRLDDLPSL